MTGLDVFGVCHPLGSPLEAARSWCAAYNAVPSFGRCLTASVSDLLPYPGSGPHYFRWTRSCSAPGCVPSASYVNSLQPCVVEVTKGHPGMPLSDYRAGIDVCLGVLLLAVAVRAVRKAL